MKPNDEDMESTLPEEPLPEPDALLDALVDAETEASPRRRTSKTLIAALLLSGLGIWQIIHVSNGGEPLFQLAAKAVAAPTKLRSDGRVPLGRVLPSTDPIVAYLERAKRGMTDQEIRWMIEDFQTLKLDETSDPEDQKAGYDGYNERFCRIQRARQNAWYLIALSEGLDLSSDQKSMVRARLDALLERDLKIFSDKWEKVRKMNGLMLGIDVDKFALPMAWLQNEACAPWNLCDLSKEQDQLTMHSWRDGERKSAPVIDPIDPDAIQGPFAWIQFAETKLDPLSGNVIKMGDSNPYEFAFEAHALLGRILVFDVFPLTPNQKDPISPTGLDQARCLQPAQLRMAMLMDPSAAASLLNQFEHPIILQSSTDDLPPNTVEPETQVDPFAEPDSK